MINVINEVKVYEINGKEAEQEKTIRVENHWNSSNKVVLEVNGFKLSIVASDLKTAIDNAVNTNKFGV